MNGDDYWSFKFCIVGLFSRQNTNSQCAFDTCDFNTSKFNYVISCEIWNTIRVSFCDRFRTYTSLRTVLWTRWFIVAPKRILPNPHYYIYIRPTRRITTTSTIAQCLNGFFFFSFYVQRTQHSCVSAMRLTSIALWLAALVGLIVSGNGEANVCRPLYDEPAYETITKIMDSPTVTSERGFFSWFVLGNDTSPAPFDEVIE